MVEWEKVSDYKYITGNRRSPDREIILDKLDNMWNVLLFDKKGDDLNAIAGFRDKREAIDFAKEWIKRDELKKVV